ncbi:protein bark beetle-like [Nylanderia fulva]|uniref:protein bark beetle-like n=1 Tax=Nylanderia fulva TaxID=613905 RepID=UPI0010FAE6B5|nr:protein bark beetle-like [Nylanderia fulva]XP_029155065.1 protein bark beetle-like [Nylanderia fulva]
MRRKMHWLGISLPILAVITGVRLDDRYEQTSIYYTEPTVLLNNSVMSNNGGLHELHGGRVVRGERILPISKSPYLLREDLFIERDGKLVIEPGVEIRFAPMIGITVRGIISSKGIQILN